MYHNNEETTMGKKSHFAIVPDRLIAKRDPKRLQIYCELYMLEVSNQKYNLKYFAKDKRISYSIAYALLREVRGLLSSSREKKIDHKQTKNKHKKNTKNNLHSVEPIDIHQLENKNKSQTNENKLQNESEPMQYRPEVIGISDGLQLQLESQLENRRLEPLLTAIQIMKMSKPDQDRYINENFERLKKAKII